MYMGAEPFDALLAELRAWRAWQYITREVDVRLTREHPTEPT